MYSLISYPFYLKFIFAPLFDRWFKLGKTKLKLSILFAFVINSLIIILGIQNNILESGHILIIIICIILGL